MKTLRINAVKVLKDMKNPLVVIETSEGPIFRPFKLALIDLHNSGRCGIVTKQAFGDGRNVPPALMSEFEMELKTLRGNEVEGDIVLQKVGDKWTVPAGHPALTDTKHKNFGVKVGDTLLVEKGGLRVTGFLEFPFSMEDRLITKTANATALNFSARFGFANIMSEEPKMIDTEHEEVEEDENEEVEEDENEEVEEDENEGAIANKTAEEAFGASEIEQPAETKASKAEKAK